MHALHLTVWPKCTAHVLPETEHIGQVFVRCLCKPHIDLFTIKLSRSTFTNTRVVGLRFFFFLVIFLLATVQATHWEILIMCFPQTRFRQNVHPIVSLA